MFKQKILCNEFQDAFCVNGFVWSDNVIRTHVNVMRMRCYFGMMSCVVPSPEQLTFVVLPMETVLGHVYVPLHNAEVLEHLEQAAIA